MKDLMKDLLITLILGILIIASGPFVLILMNWWLGYVNGLFGL